MHISKYFIKNTMIEHFTYDEDEHQEDEFYCEGENYASLSDAVNDIIDYCDTNPYDMSVWESYESNENKEIYFKRLGDLIFSFAGFIKVSDDEYRFNTMKVDLKDMDSDDIAFYFDRLPEIAYDIFMDYCSKSTNPTMSYDDVVEMLTRYVES